MGHNVDVALPHAIDDIDTEFLSAALSVTFPGTSVCAIDVTNARHGSASSFRLAVDFTDNPHRLPPSVYLKGNFIDHDYTSAAAFTGEANYYADLACTVAEFVNQPKAFFAASDEDGQAIVIMEDLTRRGVAFGDCELPLSVDQVADGVRQLAAMHAAYWQQPMTGCDWITGRGSVAPLMMSLVQPAHFGDYIARERAGFLPTELRDRDRIEAALSAMFYTDRRLPATLTHGDPHLGNVFIESSGRLGFCDFQTVGRGPYIWDVTYFLTGALTPEDRRAAESDLLRAYLDELACRDVCGVPDFEDAFLAHRRHMMHGYLSILTPEQMQPDRFAAAMGQRFAIAMQELDTLGSLGRPVIE